MVDCVELFFPIEMLGWYSHLSLSLSNISYNMLFTLSFV